ncbi:MAG: hypothetical protein CML44_03250, partial [Rhodobacteraceae bacterium]|nr:hypothetical protein [Paracoccaceae bacterium]
GLTGAQGVAGTQGMIGATGAQGDKGLTGAQGIAGTVPAGANEIVYVNSGASSVTGESAFTYNATTNLMDVDIIHAGNGSAASPSFSFQSDPDTGIYRVTTNQVGITAGGSLLMKFGAGVVELEDDTEFIPPRGQPDTTNPTSIGTSQLGRTIIRTNSNTATISSGADVGAQFSIINTNSSGTTLTINRAGSETINGATSIALDQQYAGATFFKATSTEWFAIGELA